MEEVIAGTSTNGFIDQISKNEGSTLSEDLVRNNESIPDVEMKEESVDENIKEGSNENDNQTTSNSNSINSNAETFEDNGRKTVRFGNCQELKYVPVDPPCECKIDKQDIQIQEKLITYKVKHTDFPPNISIKEYLLNHPNEKIFMCTVCNQIFANARWLRRHSKVHFGRSVVMCERCYEKFKQYNKLLKHLKTCGKYLCAFCKERFAKRCFIENHLIKHYRQKMIDCDMCNIREICERHLRACILIRTKKKLKGEKLKKCKKDVENDHFQENNSHNHFVIHEVKNFKCEKCDESFSLRSHLENHLLVHSGKRNFRCENCDEAFESAVALQNHSTIHIGEEKFECGICNQKFLLENDLISHWHVHDIGKNFRCESCGQAFQSTPALQNHLMIHELEKRFECKLCYKKFWRERLLQYHLKSHKYQDETFLCETCNKSFGMKSNLRSHLLTHWREKKTLQGVQTSALSNS